MRDLTNIHGLQSRVFLIFTADLHQIVDGFSCSVALWNLHLLCANVRLFVYAVRRNNFPPLASGCPVQPCFYQDISVDIPLELQKVVRTIYYLWLGL